MKSFHGDELYTCKICNKVIKNDIKVHKGTCIICPMCPYSNKRKDRLLHHINKLCPNKEQREPLDLSPKKNAMKDNLEPPISNIEPNNNSYNQENEEDLSVHMDEDKSTFCENFQNFTTQEKDNLSGPTISEISN